MDTTEKKNSFWKPMISKALTHSQTSNFSFAHSVFYPSGELFAIFMEFKIVVCKLFQFGRAKNLSLGKGLI